MTHENIAEATVDVLKSLLRRARYDALLTVENGDGRTFIVLASQIAGVHVDSDRLRVIYTSGSVDTFEFSKYTLSWDSENDELLIEED